MDESTFHLALPSLPVLVSSYFGPNFPLFSRKFPTSKAGCAEFNK